jgi:phosphatidylglycerol---prolipoprotein diacylglyceryl transferase
MAWVHNLDPFAIQFTETFGVRWYGLAYLMGFVLGYIAILRMSRRGSTQFKSDEKIADFVTWIAIGVLAGGRLGYGLFYSPDLFWTFDSHFPYWGLLKVNEGGMASHGGILGVMMICWLYARRNQMSFLHILDLTVFGGSIGFFFGRLANFVNGELFGRAAPEGLMWAVKFPQEIPGWLRDNFPKLYQLGPAVDALGEVKQDGSSMPVNAELWNSWLDNFTPDYSARESVHLTIESLIRAVQNGNQKVTELLAPVLTARHPSQLYQAFLEGLLVFTVLCWLWRKPQEPGVIGGWFGVLYCSARIIGEQFRMPDAQIGFELFGLTRGQWISIGLLIVAIGWLWSAYRADRQKLGGWNP